jgi:hypothetical protein
MKNNRSKEITEIIQKAYPKAQVTIKTKRIGRDNAIYVKTNAFQAIDLHGNDWVLEYTPKDKKIKNTIQKLLKKFESLAKNNAERSIIEKNTFIIVQPLM